MQVVASWVQIPRHHLTLEISVQRKVVIFMLRNMSMVYKGCLILDCTECEVTLYPESDQKIFKKLLTIIVSKKLK